jgi:hypothetical protein
MGVAKSLVRFVLFSYNGFNSPIEIQPITVCSKLETYLEILFDYGNRSYQNLLFTNAKFI